jgi:hypothetical protein
MAPSTASCHDRVEAARRLVLLALLLAVATICIISIPASEESDAASSGIYGDVFSSDGLEYKVTSASPLSASLIGYSGAPTDLEVPASVSYLGVDIPVKSVGGKAFYSCSSLTRVDLGSVETVGSKAFANCANLKTLIVPETVKTFGSYAFYGCGIVSLDIPGDDVNVGASAFSACKKMSSITFSGTGAVIGTNAFYKNNGVSTVDLSTVASVGQKAFPYCYGMETLVMPGTLQAMGGYAFYRCTGLKALAIEEGVSSIPKSAFSGCTAIEEISFPSTLTSVGANAFYGLKFVDADGVAIDPTADNLRGHMFVKSGKVLRLIDAQDGDEFFADGIIYSVTSVSDRSVSIVGHEGDVVTVPAFVSYKGLDFASESVGAKAFYNCSTLESVDLSNVRTIGLKAFANCPGISEVVFGDRLESVGGYAFYGPSFSDLNGDSVSVDADGLRGYIFFGAGKVLRMAGDIQDGEEFSVGGIAYKVVSVSDRTASIIGYDAAAGVESVPASVSYAGWNLDVVSVGAKAFYNCSTLEDVDLSNVRTIGLKAFANCPGISDVVFGDRLEAVGGYAFHGLRFLVGDGVVQQDASHLAGRHFEGKDGDLQDSDRYIAVHFRVASDSTGMGVVSCATGELADCLVPYGTTVSVSGGRLVLSDGSSSTPKAMTKAGYTVYFTQWNGADDRATSTVRAITMETWFWAHFDIRGMPVQIEIKYLSNGVPIQIDGKNLDWVSMSYYGNDVSINYKQNFPYDVASKLDGAYKLTKGFIVLPSGMGTNQGATVEYDNVDTQRIVINFEFEKNSAYIQRYMVYPNGTSMPFPIMEMSEARGLDAVMTVTATDPADIGKTAKVRIGDGQGDFYGVGQTGTYDGHSYRVVRGDSGRADDVKVLIDGAINVGSQSDPLQFYYRFVRA